MQLFVPKDQIANNFFSTNAKGFPTIGRDLRMEKSKLDPNSTPQASTNLDSKATHPSVHHLEQNRLFDISGVDCVNACYGGTAALLNTINWMESSDWDGRLAIVVAGDEAVYSAVETSKSARATGGAGAVAILIGPDAPILIERGGTTSHHMRHGWDFYKPNVLSGSPIVDGSLSINSYLSALEYCFRDHCHRIRHKKAADAHFDFMCFHAPYAKLVQKAFHLLYELPANDFHYFKKMHSESKTFVGDGASNFTSICNIHKDLLDHPASPNNSIFGTSKTNSTCQSNLEQPTEEMEAFQRIVEPSRILPKLIGNSYCASLYTGLVSLLLAAYDNEVTKVTLSKGDRIGMFSYGSGVASSMFSLLVNTDDFKHSLIIDAEQIKKDIFSRKEFSPEDFVSQLNQPSKCFSTNCTDSSGILSSCFKANFNSTRDIKNQKNSYEKSIDVNSIPRTFEGFYLEEIDKLHRRSYKYKCEGRLTDNFDS